MKESRFIIVFTVILQIVESQKSPNYWKEEKPGVDPLKRKIPAFK